MPTLEEVRKELWKDELLYPELALSYGADALPHLKTLVAEDDPRIAPKAAYLAGIIDAKASHEVVAQAAKSRHDVVRVAAAAVAAALPAEHSVSITSLLLGDADAGVRIRAMKSAATINSPALAGRLKTMSEQDDDPHVRGLAASTYQQMRR
jgi:HEAT repeat protein